jgi:hypothetical protein
VVLGSVRKLPIRELRVVRNSPSNSCLADGPTFFAGIVLLVVLVMLGRAIV